MYRKAYVRTLAAEVGLNPTEVVADFCQRFEPPVETVAVAVPIHSAALQEKWIQQLTPSPQRSIVTLAAFAAGAVAWFMLQAGPVGATVPVDYSASDFAALPMSSTASMVLTADAPHGAATPIAIAAHATAVPLRIEMTATGWCWVAAETDGQRVMYRLVEPGERVVLEGQRMIALRLGDAGSVMLSINNGASRSFGGQSQVVELVVTPENVEGLRNGPVATASGG